MGRCSRSFRLFWQVVTRSASPQEISIKSLATTAATNPAEPRRAGSRCHEQVGRQSTEDYGAKVEHEALTEQISQQDLIVQPTTDQPCGPVLPLPFELQSMLLCCMDGGSILRFRQANKECFGLVRLHETAISRALWQAYFADEKTSCLCSTKPDFFCKEKMPRRPTLDDYCQLLRRKAVAGRVAEGIADFIETARMRVRLSGSEGGYDAMRARLVSRLKYGLEHFQHFLCEYRGQMMVDLCQGNFARQRDKFSRQWELVDEFSIPCLLESFHAYQLLFLIFIYKFTHHDTGVANSYAEGSAHAVQFWELAMLALEGGLEHIDYLLRCSPLAGRRTAFRRYTISSRHDEEEFLSPDQWWTKAAMPQNELSSIRTSIMAPLCLTDRRTLYEFLRNDYDLLYFPAMIEKIQKARTEHRPLLCPMEYISLAMQSFPSEMDFVKIQQDWVQHYKLT